MTFKKKLRQRKMKLYSAFALIIMMYMESQRLLFPVSQQKQIQARSLVAKFAKNGFKYFSKFRH